MTTSKNKTRPSSHHHHPPVVSIVKKNRSNEMASACPPPNPATYCELNFIETCQNPIDTAGNFYSARSDLGGSYPFGPMEDWNNNCPPPKTVCRDYCTYSPLGRLVIAITFLRDADGVDVTEIMNAHNTTICPSKPLSIEQVTSLLAQGTKQGVFFFNSETGTYKVYGGFGVLPSNQALVKDLGPGFQLCLGMYCDNQTTSFVPE
jgi:hypothetical protein